MARERQTSRQTGKADPANRASAASVLQNAALYALLLVIAMRPLLSETYESGLQGISQAIGDPTSLTPATTALFDLVIWAAAVAAGIAGVMTGRSWKWTGLEAGWAIMVAAAVASSWAASNKRLAINASCDWLTGVALAMALASLLRDRKRVVLVLAVVAASWIASAAKCGTWLAWEADDTWRSYQEQKEVIWAGQGIPLDDPRVELFENRMKAREASGFLAHSNSQGTGLALACFAAIGLAVLGRARPAARAAGVVVAAVLFATIVATKSRGAMLAAAAGLLLLAVGIWQRDRLRRHWRLGWAIAWASILAGAAGVVGWGLARGSLPGDSLRFRWEYWQVTSRIIAEHPWTGVGALNFDRAYMMRKPIEYPEEIRDPHNLLMAVASQWGMLGCAGLVAVLLGGSWVALRRWAENAGPVFVEEIADKTLNRWIVLVVAGFVLLRIWMLRGWWLSGESGLAAGFMDLSIYGIAWILAFTILCRTAGQNAQMPDDRCRLACLAGVGVLLLHNTIDFSLFVPGTLTSFAAVVAVAVAGGSRKEIGDAGARRWVPVAVSVCGLVAVAWFVAIPVTRCTARLEQAREAIVTGADDPGRLYEAAASADSLDPTPLIELASWAAQLGGLDEALDCLHLAEQRDPLDRGIYRHTWQVLLHRYEASRSPADLLQAVVAAERALELYPESPDAHVELARLLSLVATRLGDHPQAKITGRDWRTEAAAHFRTALDLDDARPSYEIRRWSLEQRGQIAKELEQVEASATSTSAD